MSDPGLTYSEWGNSTTTPAKAAILIGTFLLAVGLTVAAAGGTAATTASPAANDETLVVTTDCEMETDGAKTDGANNLTVENPTAEPVVLTLSWNTSDRASIQVQTETRTDDGTQTTHIQSQADVQPQQIRILTGTQAQTQLSTETTHESTPNGTQTETTYNLTTTIDAADTVTVRGLADGTYALSATTDEAVTGDASTVPIDHSEVTLECDADAETATDQTAATDGDEKADEDHTDESGDEKRDETDTADP